MVKNLVGARRPRLSEALATWSYDTMVFDQPLSIDTLVSAAVSVVLPWSTWPIVPTLQWGLVRANFSLAIDFSLSDRSPPSGAAWGLAPANREGRPFPAVDRNGLCAFPAPPRVSAGEKTKNS